MNTKMTAGLLRCTRDQAIPAMTQTIPSHTLDLRSGLLGSVAYLRESYPKPDWQRHDNFSGLASHWLQIHESLRGAGAQVRQATADFREGKSSVADFQQAFIARSRQFFQHLHGHHQIEDQVYFPRFKTLDKRMVAGFELLEEDHTSIHEALVASVNSARKLVDAVALGPDASGIAADVYSADSDLLFKRLLRHLDDEEDLIVPALLHFGDRSVS
jgi:iron-sulfur cluster repair protein YtfE (RIC family)